MSVNYWETINRADLIKHRDYLFVFGDNSIRKGYGGQAKEMRGEPNAVGITTKKYPSMNVDSFFSNSDLASWIEENQEAMNRLKSHIKKRGTIVWPAKGIGTGLAKLQRYAPSIWFTLEDWRKRLQWMDYDE